MMSTTETASVIDANQPDVTSIVIVTLNQVAYTRQCVESLRDRTPEPYELIFIDNGSIGGPRGADETKRATCSPEMGLSGTTGNGIPSRHTGDAERQGGSGGRPADCRRTSFSRTAASIVTLHDRTE